MLTNDTINVAITMLRDYMTVLAHEEKPPVEQVITELKAAQLLSAQWPVRVSANTLGAIKALLAGDSNPANDTVVRVWVERAWQDIGPEAAQGVQPAVCYSHRNGETDDPKEYGYYWIETEWKGKPQYRINQWVKLPDGGEFKEPERDSWATGILNRDLIKGIYGPIVFGAKPPWEQPQPAPGVPMPDDVMIMRSVAKEGSSDVK